MSVTVTTPTPGGGTSAAQTFSITTPATNVSIVDVEGNDLVWDSQHNKFYVSVPTAASSNSKTISIVDPIAGTVVGSQSIDSEPSVLAISDDGQYLYASIQGDQIVERFTLPAVAPDIKWSLGTSSISATPYVATDIQVMPGNARTTAVVRTSQIQADGGVAIYDDGTLRAGTACGLGDYCDEVRWKSDGSQIFAEDVSSSARYFYTLGVSSGGVQLLQQYGGAFRGWGQRLHLDGATNYVYTDLGEVVNAMTGRPIGNYPAGRCQGCYADSPTFVAIDSNLGRVFVLTPVRYYSNTRSFQIQVFDQSTFALLQTFSIPNAVGVPTNFIRWGQSGLAFVTNGLITGDPTTGKLYILDGPFVNPKGTADGTNGTASNPTPTISDVSPLYVTAGDSGATITITGVDFVGQPTVLLNGSPLSTTLLSGTQVQAIVAASSLSSANRSDIAVSNPGPGGGISNTLSLFVNPSPPTGNQISVLPAGGNDLVWDSQSQKILVSEPSIQGVQGNTIATVDPAGGNVTISAFVGSDPAKLSLSSDNQYLYVGMNGENAVQRLLLPALTTDISWPLGADSFSGPYFALDLLSAPGLPHTTAVSSAGFGFSPNSTGITIYDDATARPTSAPGWSTSPYSYASLQWGSDATTLYAPAQSFPTDFYVLGVTITGVSVSKTYSDAFTFPNSDFGIHYDPGTGLIYCDSGQVVDPSTGATVGNFNASGIAAPDSALGLVFFLGQVSGQVGTSTFTIQVYDQKNFNLVDSITVSNVVGSPTGFIRWGTNGLAFSTRVGGPADFTGIGPGQLYVVSGTIVKSEVNRTRSVLEQEHVRKTWGKPATL